MATPNLLNPTSAVASHVDLALTTSAQSISSNASSSGTLVRIDNLVITNIHGTNAADVTINSYSAAALGGTASAIASTIAVPADSALMIPCPIYLLEDKSLGALASANSSLVAHADLTIVTA